MPNPNYTLNYEDFIRQVNPLLNGGNTWSQKDGDPYGLNLQLADGRVWNPSGASSGVQYTPKGSRISGGEWRDSGESGGYMTPEVLADEDIYEVSGDMSALNGAPNSRQHTNVRYKRVGDQLVPINQTDWQWASPYDSLRKAGMAAAAIYGVGSGLGGLLGGEAAAGSGVAGGAGGAEFYGSLGGLGGAEAGAAGVASGVAGGAGGAEFYGSLGGAGGAEAGAAAGGLLGSAPVTAATTAAGAAAGGGGLLSSVGGLGGLAGLAQVALPIVGAALGSQPTTTTSTNQSRLDPRMDPYIYGQDGVLPAAQEWYKANKTGLNDQMRQGLATQTAVLNDPATMAGYKQMQTLGSGLLSAPIAGNPFSDGRSSLSAPRPQLYR